MSFAEKAARIKELNQRMERYKEHEKELRDKIEKAEDAFLEDASALRPQTMTVTAFTAINRNDGKSMEAFLRVKEEPADLLEIYAKHIGLPTWEEMEHADLFELFQQRERRDRREFRSAFDANSIAGELDMEHRIKITVHGREDITFEACVASHHHEKVVDQIMIRWATNGAPDKHILNEVLDVLQRSDIDLRPGSSCENFFSSGVLEGESGFSGTFGNGLSGKVTAHMVDHRHGPHHVDRFNFREFGI